MTLRSNTLLKVLVPALLVVVLLIVVRGLSGGGDAGTDAKTGQADPTLTLSDDELQALGIEGDTPRCRAPARSEEHTSELQSRPHLVCRLLLEKKKKKYRL